MHPLVLGTFCVCIVGFLYQRWNRYLKRRDFQRIHHCGPAQRLPQIERIIGVGTMLENIKFWKAKKLVELTRARYYTAGFTYSATVAGNRTIFTIELQNIKAIFADRFDDFDVGWFRLKAFAPTIGEVLITSDGARWHHQRAMMRPVFKRRQVLDCELFKFDLDVLISRIPTDGSGLDMAPLFRTHALNLASRLLLGEPIADLNPGHWSQEFLEAVRKTNRGIELRLRFGRLLPLMPRDHEYEEAKRTLHEYADAFVQKALDHRRSWEMGEKESSNASEDRYVFLREIAKESEDPVYLRNHLLGMLLAGSETTASLMTNCLSLLSKRPDLWASLRSEVLSMDDQQLDYERVKALKSLNHVINEGALPLILFLISTDHSSSAALSSRTAIRSSCQQGHFHSLRRWPGSHDQSFRTKRRSCSDKYLCAPPETGPLRTRCKRI